ncbi:hypothetical protein [Zoogloea ramigera]|jgi:hypothetical protein|uniref:hypothetical protein n=1 Tax=Zoogloea ramigera TaxID=350 RepID=UPI003FA1B968
MNGDTPSVPALPTPSLLRRVRRLVAAALLAASTAAPAAVIIVGPDESVTRIADAARLARDGDTVLIKPGTYRGDVAVWPQKSLEIRGLGTRPVLQADGRDAEGKGIWVFVNGHFKVDNIAFRGARVADGNGAGIRMEQGSLEVRNCSFEDNQNGILTANFDDTELRVINSTFDKAPHDELGLHHLLYVGRIKHFVLEGSHLQRGYRGHLVKSRARLNEVRYNLLSDGPEGAASYELEFPEGGVAVVTGNVIAQSAASGNPVVIGYGAEAGNRPVNRLFLSHNTLINKGIRPAWFVRAWTDKLPAGTEIVTRNNLTVGFGLFTLLLPGDHRGNYMLPPGAIDPDKLELAPAPDSWLRGRLSRAETLGGTELAPRAEFAFPAGTQPLSQPPVWTPGAFQGSGVALHRPADR